MRDSPAGVLHPDRSRGTAGTFLRSHFSLLEWSGQLHPAELTCLFTGRNEGTAAKWPSPGPLLRGGKEGGRARGLLPRADRYLCASPRRVSGHLWLTGKDPDTGRDWGHEEKGTTEDEMAGWHHRLDGREFE